MYQEVIRTDEEISDLREQISDQINQGSSKFHGMTYEQGLDAMIEWLLYKDEDMESAYGGPMDD